MVNQSKDPRISLQGMKVLQAFSDNASTRMSGSDVYKLTHLSSGTLYPILLRFEEAGWLTSDWENVDPSKIGRPRKRLYWITPMGLSKASDVFGLFTTGKPA